MGKEEDNTVVEAHFLHDEGEKVMVK